MTSRIIGSIRFHLREDQIQKFINEEKSVSCSISTSVIRRTTLSRRRSLPSNRGARSTESARKNFGARIDGPDSCRGRIAARSSTSSDDLFPLLSPLFRLNRAILALIRGVETRFPMRNRRRNSTFQEFFH